MLQHRMIIQSIHGTEYRELFQTVIEAGEVTHFDVAVAYATVSGVEVLSELLGEALGDQWRGIRKRWLIGIDWCRTEPGALDMLSQMQQSQVRIYNGESVVNRPRCTPMSPFHPKLFLLRGGDLRGIVVGSGNLSRNGMTGGIEAGYAIVVTEPLEPGEDGVWQEAERLRRQLNSMWREATRLADVIDDYQHIYSEVRELADPTPTDDDAARTERLRHGRRAISPELMRQLRACRNLWIQAGNLHSNRGPGRPGNQLMMSPMTRVFFGFAADDVEPDTHIGYVRIRYGGHTRDDCSLRFSNNSMDVLTLPVPGTDGPDAYDQETLLFTEETDALGRVFALRIGSRAEIRHWMRQSQRIESLVTMTGGRQWGVF